MKTLVTGALQASPEEMEELREYGLEIDFLQQEKDPVDHPEQYEAVIGNGLFLYHDIAAFTNLRYIQLTSQGYDRVPMDYVKEHCIEIHNAGGAYSVPMAEWTVMRILELYKNADRFYTRQSAHEWIKERNLSELSGKTACIIGFGAYGTETAKRLKAFGVRICAVDYVRRESDLIDAFYLLPELDTALKKADIVILAIALVKDTYYLLNAEKLALLKPEAVVLNAARGPLIDEKVLADALSDGRIRAAALDVFETEPLPQDSPLWDMKNVLLSPHNSFVGTGNHERLMQVVMENLGRRI